MRNDLTGINIQWPISELILSGKKTVETRTYPLSDSYKNQLLVLIETPGPKGKFKARAKAIIKFTECISYKDKEDFYLDSDRHCVTPGSPWEWQDEKPKFGWLLEIVEKFEQPIEIKQRKGIIFTNNVQLT